MAVFPDGTLFLCRSSGYLAFFPDGGAIPEFFVSLHVMAGFNFGFFGNQEHRVFNYKPRYYDPEEEKRRQMFGDVDGTNEKAAKDGAYIPGSNLRGAFRNGNYQKTRSSMNKIHGIITIVTLLLIATVLVFFSKFF